MKILIADDDLTSRMMLKNLTSNWGFEPILVEDGEAAWDVLQGENSPHILLLDWEMPKLDGLQLSERIREIDTNNPPYIILLTGRSEAEDIAEGLTAGANDYLSKPFKKVELQARIKVGRRLLKLQLENIQAQAATELAACVFTHALEGIVITDKTGKIIDVNKTFTHITGYSREESLNKNSKFLRPENHDQAWKAVLTTGQWSGEVWNKRKNGEAFVQQLTINTVSKGDNKVKHYIGMFSDITDRVRYQEKLTHAATHDGLTNLPNRLLLNDRLHQAMAQTRRTGSPLAVAYLDLDGFKAVNDQFGHDEGDKLLINFANNLSNIVRDTDTVARVGGDEFAVLLTGLDNPNGCKHTLTRILAAATTSVEIGGIRANVSASIGVSLFDKDDDALEKTLLDRADQAMYRAKNSGKNCFKFFAEQPLN